MLVVVDGSASARKCPAPTSVSASGVVMPSSVPSYRPSLSLSGSSALIRPSPSVSSAKLASAPSSTPSSSLSASAGSVPITTSSSSGNPSPSVSVGGVGWSSAGLLGSRSPASTWPS